MDYERKENGGDKNIKYVFKLKYCLLTCIDKNEVILSIYCQSTNPKSFL